ncbi:unnamed protein product [Arabis nemorensis]|uniref:Cytochrome P450 n=1 Tax=Arabis nemorensis TaxID=586526 RepID=A0A565AP13_9BRAS|nr:unnamed protein product [Arabis nemorensis]
MIHELNHINCLSSSIKSQNQKKKENVSLPLFHLPHPFFLIFLKNLKPSKWNLPPGPKKLPIIGNLHNIKGMLHLCLRDFSQTYGPVMLLQFGFVPTVVITSKEAAEEVLKIHDLECCSRSLPLGLRTVTYNCKDIGFAPYGEKWKAMFIREEENDLLVKKLTESALRRSPVNLRKTLYTIIGSIVCRIAFGQNLHDCKFMDEDSITDLLLEVSLIDKIVSFSDFFPGRIGRFIDWISGKNKRLKNAFSEPDIFFQNILDEHLKPEEEK